MSLFANLTRSEDIAAASDNTGRARLQQGLHEMTVEYAYVVQAASGATGVALKLTSEAGTHNETVYVTSGTAKGGKHYYTDAKGVQRYLPGFTLINDMCRLTLDKELAELETEEKTLMLYNYDAKKEMPQNVQVFMDLVGQTALVGIKATEEDKYKTPTESVVKLSVDKVFHPETRCTVVELESGLTEGVYADTWAKNNAEVQDKRVLSKGGLKPANSTAPFNGGTPPATGEKKPSLFGKKAT